MSRAADRLLAVLERVAARGGHIVLDLIGDRPFVVGEHFPPDDVYDETTGASFFFHAHEAGSRDFDERGHFHCFVERRAVPRSARPLKRPGRPIKGWGLCHLIGVSIDPRGVPAHLFTTNQWVTKEWLYPAPVVTALLDRFVIEKPSLVTPASEWITFLLALFRPQVEFLLLERDQAFAAHSTASGAVFRDQSLEIPSSLQIDLDRQIAAVDRAVRRRCPR